MADLRKALIKLIPAQAKKIRDKRSAAAAKPPLSPRRKLQAVVTAQTAQVEGEQKEEEEDQRQQQQVVPKIQAFQSIYANDCEARASSFEAKLVALLERCELGAQRAEACMWAMREVCAQCGPLSHVLGDILKQLELAVFSCSDGERQGLKQVPYFEVVSRLEKAAKNKEVRLESWRASLLQYLFDIDRLEQEMEVLKGQVRNGEFLNKSLTASIEVAASSVEAANEEVETARKKFMDAKKQLKEIKAEVKQARSDKRQQQYDADFREQEKLKAEYGQLVNEFQHFQSFLDNSRTQIAACVPRPNYLSIKAQVLELQGKLSELQGKSVKPTHETTQLTPRPVWTRGEGGVQDPTLSTLEQVAQICKQNIILSNKLSMLQGQWTDTNVALAEVSQRYDATEKKGKSKR